MILPGVPREKRIHFVEKMVEQLLENGLAGITPEEHHRLRSMTEDLLSSVEPVPEPVRKEEPTVKPEPC